MIRVNVTKSILRKIVGSKRYKAMRDTQRSLLKRLLHLPVR